MWTLILLDYNGHRKEVKWNGKMYPLQYFVPIIEPITSAMFDIGPPPILKKKSYKPSSICKGKKMVIYLEEIEGG